VQQQLLQHIRNGQLVCLACIALLALRSYHDVACFALLS
jgi:hypothetical protein